jgi:DNA helicase-2/ATP-dependent DNA helicase PcrA
VTRIEPTAEQLAVMEFPPRPLRVTAGAGTGKTTTMALRLAHLVRTEGVAPEEALGVTFTNKATEELADRIRAELAAETAAGRSVEVATYHGFAYGILREFGAVVGIERTARVVTPGYTRQLLRDAFAAGTYRHLDLSVAGRQVEAAAALAGRLADHVRRPEELLDLPSDTDAAPARRELAETLIRYQAMKRSLDIVDYSDLISASHRLVSQHPDLARQIRARYRAVLLDEYQDTNPAQRELFRMLFGDGFPVTAVGDGDQTIYEWRGASLQNFERFPDHFVDDRGRPAATLSLTLNRRSDRAVLGVANEVRSRIEDRQAIGELRPRPEAAEGVVAVAWLPDAATEAAWIAEEVVRLHDEDEVRWADVALLFRKNAQIGLVREALEAAGVPVEVAALGGLLGVPEVSELHAWLRLLGRPEDGPALVRILLGSRYRLGLGDLAPLADWIRAQGGPWRDDEEDLPAWTMLEAIEALDDLKGVRPEAARRLSEFLALFRDLLQAAQGVSLVELCRRILDQTGAWHEIEAMDPAPRLSARLNLYRFLDLAEDWSPLEGRPSLGAFLDHLDLLAEDETSADLDTAGLGSENAVAMLTVHRAKGLEWPVVFLPALCEGTFPSRPGTYENPLTQPAVLPWELRLDAGQFAVPLDDEDAVKELLRSRHAAQEWRTAYVAVTRARHRLYGTGGYWYGGKRPKGRSDLYTLLEAHPAAVKLRDTAEPGEPPEPGSWDEEVAAPDPVFTDGWAGALRSAADDPAWPETRAAELGVLEPYHAEMEQLTLVLDGLPSPLEPEPADSDLRTSVTGLVTYATCPQRFRWAEVDRLPRRPTAAQRRGIEVHRRIELHHRGTLALEDASDDFYDVPAAATPAAVTEAADPFRTFLNSRFAEASPRFVEEPFELRLSGARVRGRIDAIYEPAPGRWEVVDFKSGRPSDDPAATVQLEAYAVAATDVGFAGEHPEQLDVSFAFLGDGLTIRSWQATPQWTEEARTHLEALAEAAADAVYPATPSRACRSCDFDRFCPEGRAWLADNG